MHVKDGEKGKKEGKKKKKKFDRTLPDLLELWRIRAVYPLPTHPTLSTPPRSFPPLSTYSSCCLLSGRRGLVDRSND